MCTIECISGTGHTVKELYIETPATADTGNTIVVDLTAYGGLYLKHIRGCVHSTANSILIEEAPTTAVSAGTLTITLGGSGANNLVRVYRVLFI